MTCIGLEGHHVFASGQRGDAWIGARRHPQLAVAPFVHGPAVDSQMTCIGLEGHRISAGGQRGNAWTGARRHPQLAVAPFVHGPAVDSQMTCIGLESHRVITDGQRGDALAGTPQLPQGAVSPYAYGPVTVDSHPTEVGLESHVIGHGSLSWLASTTESTSPWLGPSPGGPRRGRSRSPRAGRTDCWQTACATMASGGTARVLGHELRHLLTGPAWLQDQTLTVGARRPAVIGTLPDKGIACGTGQDMGTAGTIGVPLVPAGRRGGLVGAGLSAAELRAGRLGLGMTQRQLAAELGVAPTTLARWERGERAISNPVLVRLALDPWATGPPPPAAGAAACPGDRADRPGS